MSKTEEGFFESILPTSIYNLWYGYDKKYGDPEIERLYKEIRFSKRENSESFYRDISIKVDQIIEIQNRELYNLSLKFSPTDHEIKQKARLNNCLDLVSSHGYTMLHKLLELRAVEAFGKWIKAGADPNILENKVTVLYKLIVDDSISEREEFFKLLIKSPNLDMTFLDNNDSSNILLLALKHNRYKLAVLLIKEHLSKIILTPEEQIEFLIALAKRKNYSLIEELNKYLDKKNLLTKDSSKEREAFYSINGYAQIDPLKYNIIHILAKKGDLESLFFIMNHIKDLSLIHEKNREGNNLLLLLLETSNPAVDHSVLHSLSHYFIDFQCVNKLSYTALHLAIRNKNKIQIFYLVNIAKLNPNIRSTDGEYSTPLYELIKDLHKDGDIGRDITEIFATLLKAGANLNEMVGPNQKDTISSIITDRKLTILQDIIKAQQITSFCDINLDDITLSVLQSCEQSIDINATTFESSFQKIGTSYIPQLDDSQKL